MKKAIIDIGSNTINVIIAEVNGAGWIKLAEFKSPARLAKGGIDKNMLSPEAMDRGVLALKEHLQQAKDYNCEQVVAYATAAVRDAKNKDVFLDRVRDTLNLEIQVISGDREAELIAHGIMASGALSGGANLVVDIGGGSTEFILIENGEILFKQSFRLGVTRLLEKFNPTDPLSEDDLQRINQHIESSLEDLLPIIKEHKPVRLVGASGSFDSLAQMTADYYNHTLDEVHNKIDSVAYHELANLLLVNDHDARAKIKGLMIHRVDTLPMAILLINHVLSIGGFDEIHQSSYALKEGVLSMEQTQ